MKQKVECITCGKGLNKRSAIFKCPVCSKKNIARCSHCRKLGIKYKCECGFEGP